VGHDAHHITGSFIIGFFASLTGTEGRWLVSPAFRTFFMIWHLRRLHDVFLIQPANSEPGNEGEWTRAGANILLSVVLCLAGVWLGWLLANNFSQMK